MLEGVRDLRATGTKKKRKADWHSYKFPGLLGRHKLEFVFCFMENLIEGYTNLAVDPAQHPGGVEKAQGHCGRGNDENTD